MKSAKEVAERLWEELYELMVGSKDIYNSIFIEKIQKVIEVDRANILDEIKCFKLWQCVRCGSQFDDTQYRIWKDLERIEIEEINKIFDEPFHGDCGCTSIDEDGETLCNCEFQEFCINLKTGEDKK
jgi:hypothetical protein